MKLKKYLMTFLMVLGTMLTLNSCSKDDDGGFGYDTALIGSWESIERFSSGVETLRITFLPEGKGVMTNTYISYSSPEPEIHRDEFSWSTKGNKFKVYFFADKETDEGTYSIQGDSLIIKSINEEGREETEVFTRVKE